MNCNHTSFSRSLALALFLLFSTVAWGQSYKVLHNFGGPGDGLYPNGGLLLDGQGNLYGVTMYGPQPGCQTQDLGCGTAFELTPNSNGSWNETTLYAFQGGNNDGGNPFGPLIRDRQGNLYGVTTAGFYSGLGGARGDVSVGAPNAGRHQ